MQRAIVKLQSFKGNDSSVVVNTTGHPDRDVLFCVVTIEGDKASPVDFGYRTLTEAQEIVQSSSGVPSSAPEASDATKKHSTYFGACPRCGETDGYENVGSSHWFVCDKHKTKWFVGENLFSSAMYETPEQQRKHLQEIGFDSYEVVEPVFPVDPEIETER